MLGVIYLNMKDELSSTLREHIGNVCANLRIILLEKRTLQSQIRMRLEMINNILETVSIDLREYNEK